MAWNDLTEREKQLDSAIENCGIQLDNSDSCLKNVMKVINAKSNEIEFVRQRISLRIRTKEMLNRADRFIEETNQMLDSFEKDDEKWKTLGKN